jgi:major vault protein
MSAGTPKQSDLMKTLCLHCGPDFMRDAIIVETSDHARLKLEVSYNWEFDLTRPNIGDLMFNVPDFIGDACKAIASRIRGAVAGEPFDVMHKNAVTIIRGAVFDDPSGRLVFPSNGLVVTNVDVHSVDPVDAKTSEALTKAVQLAIEITTSSQEATARQTALKLEQAAKGRLERQIITDKVATERSQKGLLELQAINAAIEATGESTAEAKAKAAALLIEGETEVALAEKRIAAETITAKAELDVYRYRRELEIGHKAQMYTLETEKLRGMAKIEADKFTKLIGAVGRDTIKALASAGPETQAALLKGLGLQGYLVTDGSNPINLFNAARGMTAAPTLPQ